MLLLAATMLPILQSCALNGTPPVVVNGVCGRYSVILPTDKELIALGPATRRAIFDHNDKYLADCP